MTNKAFSVSFNETDGFFAMLKYFYSDLILKRMMNSKSKSIYDIVFFDIYTKVWYNLFVKFRTNFAQSG